MGEVHKIKDIKKDIKSFANEYQIADYLKNNSALQELLDDDEFVNQLKTVNKKFEEGLKIYYEQKIENNIKKEIDEMGLRKIIEDESKISKIPREYKEELYTIAKEYEEKGEYEKAKQIYDAVVKFGKGQVFKFNERYGNTQKNKETTYYQAKYSYYICKIKNGEELTEEDKKDLEELVKEDKDNILNLTTPGKVSNMDIFYSFFKDLSIEELSDVILPKIPTGKHRTDRDNPNPPNPPKDYPEELSPEKRLEHIKSHYDIAKVKMGIDKMIGYFIFEVKDSNVIIVEKFYKVKGRKNNKTIAPSDSAATYLVHKSADIDLGAISVGQLAEKKRTKSKEKNEHKLVDSVNHRGDYYTRLDNKFKALDDLVIDGEEKISVTNRDTTTEGITESREVIEKTSETVETDNNEEIKPENETEKKKKSENLDELSDTKESEEVLDNTQYSLEELNELIKYFDEEWEEFKERKAELDSDRKAISDQIEEIKEKLYQGIDENLAAGMAQIIEEQLKILNEQQKEMNRIAKEEEKLIKAEKSNRAERGRLAKQFKAKLMGGED